MSVDPDRVISAVQHFSDQVVTLKHELDEANRVIAAIVETVGGKVVVDDTTIRENNKILIVYRRDLDNKTVFAVRDRHERE